MATFPSSLKSAPRFAACPAVANPRKVRVLFALAATFVVSGTVLSLLVSRWFALVPLLVGANQGLMSAVGWCPVSKLLDRIWPAL